MKLTAIILTRGDKKIKGLVKSLSFCDEVLVLRNGEFKDFAYERNKAAKKAKGDWIFYVDDDEEVTSELGEEIVQRVNNSTLPFTAYAVARRNFVFGKEFKHCGQWPDYQKRLFLGSALKKWEGQLHEEPIYEGRLGYLDNPLIHRKETNLGEMVAKTNEWSEIEGKLMYEAKHPRMNLVRFATAILREFWLRMVRQRAFLDGPEGIIYGLYQVFSRFVSYAKLWEKQYAGGDL